MYTYRPKNYTYTIFFVEFKKKNETNSVVIELQNNEYILFLRYQLPLFRNNRFFLENLT